MRYDSVAPSEEVEKVEMVRMKPTVFRTILKKTEFNHCLPRARRRFNIL